ncbi:MULTISPECIES: restriction endonuclease subunit S [Aeromonas]|uniref:restriction endonuclease subunit S n=1 Tax=Aeromonas TaxID=642 RepID=UPI000CDDAC43|nr:MULTISPECIES: restriction endonuclease subunit S [Aeromonas]AUZ76712.1 restriction endonuclease subunit S [Aeromonas sp. ASNIH4]POU40301.1 restriction endonuclease subunit S [Aeromonas hydrophila]POV89761.1 restriction endonuclease subunit S [Aeromonas sp. ASNIH6]
MAEQMMQETADKAIPAGYKQTEVGVIPEDWVVANLSAITEHSRPISYGIVQTGPLIVNGVPCIRVVDISDGKIKRDNLITTTKEISNSYRRTILQDGDLIIPLRGKVGEVGLVDGDLVGANLTRGVALIAPQKDYTSEFIKQYLSNRSSADRLLSSMNGSALQEITIETLRRFSIALPIDVKEQTAIANVLSDSDALIDALEQLIAKKQAIKSATMQQLLTGRTRLPAFALRPDGTPKGYKPSELGDIPDDWEVVSLGDVIQKVTGGGTPSRANPTYWGNEIPWVTVKDFATFNPSMAQEYITKTGLANSSSNLIPRGTLITSTRMALGKAVVYDVDVAINQDLKAIFPNSDVVVSYLFYWFELNAVKIDDLGSGSTVKGLSLGDLRNLSFLLLSSEEQTAIATILSDMDNELQALTQKLEKARALKQGMMQQLLTGKIRLPLAAGA